MLKKIFILVIFLIISSSPLFAEVLVLNSGDIVEGKIIERTDDYVTIDPGYGIDITYYLDEIESIGFEDIDSYDEVDEADDIEEIDEDIIKEVDDDEAIKEDTEKDKSNFSKEKNTTSNNLIFGSRQEDYLIEQIKKQETAPKENKGKVWKDGEYLSAQVDKQLHKQLDNIKEYSNDFVGNFKQKFDSLALKFKEQNPDLYDKVIMTEIKIEFFFRGFLDYIKDANKYVLIVLAVIYYILFCIPLMFVAKKLGFKKPWIVLIPIVQLFFITRMAGKSFAFASLLFLPILNIFVFANFCSKIAEFLQEPRFIGTLMIIPGLNLLAAWYLALSKSK